MTLSASDAGCPRRVAAALWSAPAVVVSHVWDVENDGLAVFNYGNARALALWELEWEEFCGMASRQSAPLEDSEVQRERQEALAAVMSKGGRAVASGCCREGTGAMGDAGV